MSYDKDMDARSMTRDEDEEELSLGEEFDDDEVVPTQTVTPAQTPSGSVNVPTSVRSMADQFPASFKRALGAAEAEKNGQRVEGPSATSASTMTPVAVSTSGAPSSDVPSTRKSPRTARTTSTQKEMIALRGEVNSVMNSVTKRVQTLESSLKTVSMEISTLRTHKEGLADQRDTLKRQRQADSDSEDSDESWRGPPPAKESGRRKAPLPKKRTRRERSESDSSASGEKDIERETHCCTGGEFDSIA
ncbi:hypothetical protein B0H13DRAFT_2115478 [Mycena leptocephala]|nr:hypothetical protein B0H13DRAFT_2115478 [Mycena leptocephala]